MFSARLPFKVLAQKTDANVSSSANSAPQKRKLSDGAVGPVKAPKTPRSKDEKKVKNTHEGTENEVAEPKKSSASRGLLEKFVKTTEDKQTAGNQSKSNTDLVVDLTEQEEQETKTQDEASEKKVQEENMQVTEEKENEPDVAEKKEIAEEEQEPKAEEKKDEKSADTSKTPKTKSAVDTGKTPEPSKAKFPKVVLNFVW